jgi:hypothetical protein
MIRTNLMNDPVTGLLLPRQFVDQKVALKKTIDDVIDRAVNANQHIDHTYYLTVHAKFNKFDPDKFEITPPILTSRLPPFTSNQMVFWVSNKKGICELLWMVVRDQNKKLKVEFNKTGIAYLQAKGAMPAQ